MSKPKLKAKDKPDKPEHHKPGVCPWCGGEDLDYGTMEPEGEFMLYPWDCNDCGHSGTEVAKISFHYHEVNMEEK